MAAPIYVLPRALPPEPSHEVIHSRLSDILRILNNEPPHSSSTTMTTKLPLRPKSPAAEHVDLPPQTLPYRPRQAHLPPPAGPPAARLFPILAGHPPTACLPPLPPYAHPPPPPGLTARLTDEDLHLHATAQRTYRRNMLLLAADVKARLASRGRRELHDTKLAASVRSLDKLVGCFVSPLRRLPLSPAPQQYAVPPFLPYSHKPTITLTHPLPTSSHHWIRSWLTS